MERDYTPYVQKSAIGRAQALRGADLDLYVKEDYLGVPRND